MSQNGRHRRVIAIAIIVDREPLTTIQRCIDMTPSGKEEALISGRNRCVSSVAIVKPVLQDSSLYNQGIANTKTG